MQDSCMLGTTHSTEIQLPAKRERTGFCLSVMNNLESCDRCPKTFQADRAFGNPQRKCKNIAKGTTDPGVDCFDQ